MATKKNTTINGNEYYRIRRTIDGKQKSFYGSSKGDAERKYKEFLEEYSRDKVERRRALDTSTLDERAFEYIYGTLMVSSKYAAGTKDRYKSAYKCYIEGSKLGKMIVSRIRPADVQAFYNSLDVTSSTLRAIHKFLSAFNKWLQLNDYAPDFLSAVELPEKTDLKRHDGIVVWTEDEVKKILNYVDCDKLSDKRRLDFLILVLLYTGARISEAIALKYSDFKDGMINIERQCYRGEIKAPKHNSCRQVPMHRVLEEALEKHKAWHKRDMIEHKYITGYVFTTSTGNFYSTSSIRKSLVRTCEKIGIPYKHIHAYRATFCTQLCRCDVPLEVASSLLGHKNLEVTAAHYALIKTDSKQDAIDRLEF